MRKNRWLAVVWLVGLLPILAFGATPQSPRTLAEIPINQCTPHQVLGLMLYASIQREGDSAKAVAPPERAIEKTDGFTPIRSLERTHRESDDTESSRRVREASRTNAYSPIQSPRGKSLQRDIDVMGQAVDAIEKLRRGAPDLKSKSDPEGNGASLVGLLRKVEEGTTSNSKGPPNSCSLDLALVIQQQIVITEATPLLHSPERREWDELKAKYKITGQLDPKLLPSPDREKATWLIKAVIEPTSRNRDAVNDLEYLRRFAMASSLEYSNFRDDIIAGAGADDYDYDTAIKKFMRQRTCQ